MIAFFELHPEEHFVNVCVRAFMTVMNDRLIQVRSRLFFESSSLCSGIVEHLTLLTSVPGQIELVNTETPRQVGHACLWRSRGCLGVIFHGIPVIFYSKEVCFQLQGNLARMAQQPLWVFHVSDRKHGACALEFVECMAVQTPLHSSPIRQLGWRDLWHGDPRKPILFSGRLVLSETVSWKTHREFRCLPVGDPSRDKKLTCTVKTGGLAL